MYYERVPTFEWLAEANITPSNITTYSLSDIQGTLKKAYGAQPYVGCSGPRYNTTDEGMAANSTDTGRTVISEVWYYSHVDGRPQEGKSVSVGAGSFNTSCAHAEGALHYYERSEGSVRK